MTNQNVAIINRARHKVMFALFSQNTDQRAFETCGLSEEFKSVGTGQSC